MNLDYKILWYDDHKEYFESLDNDYILSEISSWGFRPQIIPIHHPDDLHQHAPFDEFDMLVVDLDLGEDVSGASFIKSVRDLNVYAEIIFYSMKGDDELWQAVSRERLQGVYVVYKKGIDSKLLQVARQSVSKVLDLENMRGIVMSEVGDLDVLLEKIFTLAMKGIAGTQQEQVFKGFVKKAKEPDKKFEDALLAFEQEPTIEKLLQLCDGSDKRVQNYNRVRKHHPLLKDAEGADFAKAYQDEVLWPRNCLAHGVPQRMEDKSFLFRHKGKDFVFNEDVSHALRQKILEYRSAFAEIAGMLEK